MRTQLEYLFHRKVFVFFINIALLAVILIPGIGVALALLLIFFILWVRRERLYSIGFSKPQSWPKVLIYSFLFGLLFQLFLSALLEPFIAHITKVPLNYETFEGIRGSWATLIMWLVFVWVFVVFIEETVFRGYLMNEMKKYIPESGSRDFWIVIISSAIFGLAHSYQGISGIITTGITGAFLGYLFVRNAYNIWMPLLVHGIIDTIGLYFIYANIDLYFYFLWDKI